MTVASEDAISTLNGSEVAPEGYRWVLQPETRPEGARLVRTLAWRVYEDEEVLIDELAETFRDKRHSTGLRWLFEQPAVRKVIFERIQAQSEVEMTDFANIREYEAVWTTVRDAELAYIDENHVLLYVSMPLALWESISADGT